MPRVIVTNKDGTTQGPWNVTDEVYEKMKEDMPNQMERRYVILPDGIADVNWAIAASLNILPQGGGFTHRSHRGPGGGRRR